MFYLKIDLESGRPHDLRPSQTVGAKIMLHSVVLHKIILGRG